MHINPNENLSLIGTRLDACQLTKALHYYTKWKRSELNRDVGYEDISISNQKKSLSYFVAALCYLVVLSSHLQYVPTG